MFTATMPMKCVAESYLNDYVLLFEEGNMGGACHNVKQMFQQIYPNEKPDGLIEYLKPSDSMSTIIFVNSSKSA